MLTFTYVILDKLLTHPVFKDYTFKQFNELKIVDALPDDYLLDPSEIPPIVIMSDRRLDSLFTEIFVLMVDWRWDAYNKCIPILLTSICQVAIKYQNNEGFRTFIDLMCNKLPLKFIDKIRLHTDYLQTFNDIAELFGMVPPVGFSQIEKSKYVYNGADINLPLTFPENDRVILNRIANIGIKFAYTTRSDLRLNFTRLVIDNSPGIFIVLPNTPIIQFSINKTLYLTLEPLNEVKDDVLIGLGRLTEYKTYGVEEFISCIDPAELRKVWPHDQSKMSKNIIKNIIGLLNNTGYHDLSDKLSNRLEEYCLAKADLLKRLNQYLIEFNSFNNQDKTTIIAIMTNMLMAGMYMRRWKTNTYPYPISKEESSIEFNPDANVSIAMLKVTDLLINSNVEVFVNGLPSFCLNYLKDNSIMPTKMSIGEIIAKTVSGESCIRIYSVIFITTAQVYTKLFTEVDLLPEINELDYIN